MPTYHGGLPISTSDISSIQQSIFKLMQQVDELAAMNNCKKRELTTIQQILSTFIDPENPAQEEEELQFKFQSQTQTQQQQQEELASAEVNAQNSTITIQQQQTQIQIVTEMQQKIQKSTNAITTKAEQQQQYQSMDILDQELSLQDQQKTNNKSKIKNQREANLELQDGFADLRSGKVEADNEKNGAEVGAYVTGGLSASKSITGAFAKEARCETVRSTMSDLQRSHRESGVTIELATTAIRRSDSEQSGGDLRGSSGGDVAHDKVADGGNTCSSAEDGTFTEMTEEAASDDEAEYRCGAEDGASAKGTGATHNALLATIGDGDLRACRIRRVFPTVAKPPPLLVAVFPWNREREVQECGAPTAIMNEVHVKSGGDHTRPWLATEREDGKGQVRETVVEKDHVGERGWGSLQARPWIPVSGEAPAVSRATGNDGGCFVRKMMEASWGVRIEDARVCWVYLGQTNGPLLIGLSYFRNKNWAGGYYFMKHVQLLNKCAPTYFFFLLTRIGTSDKRLVVP